MKQLILNKRCFKIEKENAQAMIDGYDFNGKHIYQAIYCDVINKPFPMLITLNKHSSKFTLSEFGRQQLNPESFKIPYKYIAVYDSEYFIINDIQLWKNVCNNGLFNIWSPYAPYKRFSESKKDSSEYRILLLRIYEIIEEFSEEEIYSPSNRIDHLIAENRKVTIKAPLIDDISFLKIKTLLQKSVEPYRIQVSQIDTVPSIPQVFPDEIEETEIYIEGAKKKVSVNTYERNPEARKRCLEVFGTQCRVCGFDFGIKYGKLGEGFIHVHHLIPFSEINEEYKLNPIEHLAPVCPNCHAMLHRKKPALTIEELQNILTQVAI